MYSGESKFECKTKNNRSQARNSGNRNSKTPLFVFRERSAVLLLSFQVWNNSATMEYIFMTYYNYLKEHYC